MNETQTREANPLANILFNIVLPVAILNQLSRRFGDNGPKIALILALLLPFTFGLKEWIQSRRINPMSLIGLVNIVITGTLAIASLHGQWFVLKEAALPTILGLAVLASAFTKKPFVQTIFLNEKLIKVDRLKAKLQETGSEPLFLAKLKQATILLSGSFAFSAVVNFVLARMIFSDIDPGLSQPEQAVILNEQIAQMTWMTALIILVPSILFTLAVMWYVLRAIHQLTGLKLEEVMQG